MNTIILFIVALFLLMFVVKYNGFIFSIPSNEGLEDKEKNERQRNFEISWGKVFRNIEVYTDSVGMEESLKQAWCVLAGVLMRKYFDKYSKNITWDFEKQSLFCEVMGNDCWFSIIKNKLDVFCVSIDTEMHEDNKFFNVVRKITEDLIDSSGEEGFDIKQEYARLSRMYDK